MKKQIVFYVVWDVLFTLFLYAYCIINRLAEKAYYRGGPLFPIVVLPLIVGIFFACLVLISNRYDFTRKLAVIEFVLVGGLALYFASLIVLPGLVITLTGHSGLSLFSVWWMNATIPVTIGSILLGYEVVMFIVRMNRCKKVNQTSASNQ